MKKLLLAALLFGLLGMVGCVNKIKINNPGTDETISIPANILKEDEPTSIPTEPVTEGKSAEDLNDNGKDGVQGETTDKFEDISLFIPNGWHILEKNDGKFAIAEGDLNQDGIMDKAFVIEEEDKQTEEEFYAPPRSLLIAFKNEDNTYSLSIKADNAIMLRNQGGVFGDPFQDIKIERGTLLLEFYGGSNYRWYMYYRFRYQDDGWYLIGVTKGSYFTGTATMDTADEEDYNLLTGDYIIKKYEDGQLKTKKGNRGKRPLVNLKDFVPGEEGSEF